MNIAVNPNDRVFITGKTGSGKTVLARHLTANLSRLVVLDGKGTLREWGLGEYGPDTRRVLLHGGAVRLRAAPGVDDKVNEYWQGVLKDCYDAGDVTIYIDELYSVCPPNFAPPPALWSLYTRGREFGIGVWSATQRPVYVPLVALSESEHYFMFRLSLDEDKKRMAAFMGSEVMGTISEPFGFRYSYVTWDKPVFVRKLAANPDYIINFEMEG